MTANNTEPIATLDDVRYAAQIVLTLAETVRALGTVPSGELYAQVMGYLTLEQYEYAVRALVASGLVARTNHQLTWIGR